MTPQPTPAIDPFGLSQLVNGTGPLESNQSQQAQTSSQSVPTAKPPAKSPWDYSPEDAKDDAKSFISQVGTGLWNTAKGIGSTALAAGEVAGSGFLGYDAKEPMKTLRENLWDPQVAQAKQAVSAAQGGNYSEALGHGVAAITPGAGPAAANIGQKIRSGDYTGAGADATTLGLTMAAPHIAGSIPDPFKLSPEVAAERAWRPTPADASFPQSTVGAGSDVKTYGDPSVRTNAHTIPASNGAIGILQRGMETYLTRAERAGVQIPGDTLVYATRQAIPDLLWQTDPTTAQGLVDSAQHAFGGRYFDVARWRDWLKTSNASLNKFYSQAGAKQASAGIAGTAPAIEAAQTAAMRNALYQYLSPEDNGAGPQQIQARTGDVINLRDNASRASNRITGEHALTPMEGVGKSVTGAVRIAGAPFQNMDIPGAYRQMTNPMTGPTDALIGRFYDAVPHAEPIPQPANPVHPFANQRQIGPGDIRMGPITPDASYVRSAPAMYPTGPNPQRALPPPNLVTPPPADTSYVRSAQAQAPYFGENRQLPAPQPGQPPVNVLPNRSGAPIQMTPGGWPDVNPQMPRGLPAPPPPEGISVVRHAPAAGEPLPAESLSVRIGRQILDTWKQYHPDQPK